LVSYTWTVLALAAWQSASPAPDSASLVKQAATQEDRARLAPVLLWPPECEADHQAALAALESAAGRLQFFELGKMRYVVAVGCARGAYQDVLRLFLYDESASPAKAAALTVPTYVANADAWELEELEEVGGDVTFDARAKALTIFSRARGFGDCGFQARYTLKDDRLVTVDFRARECDGDPEKAPPPAKWPRVTPSPAPAK
jgi:hypothetical protein